MGLYMPAEKTTNITVFLLLLLFFLEYSRIKGVDQIKRGVNEVAYL